MRKLSLVIVLVCACNQLQAQTNFVKNPSFEKYDTCPDNGSQIIRAKYWQNAIIPDAIGGAEYINSCADLSTQVGVPYNYGGYQFPRSGDGMGLAGFYYDKTLPAPPPIIPFNTREYFQTELIKNLTPGKSYCLRFWVNLSEASGYAHNKIGALVDNGNVNTKADSAGEEISSILPQVYTDKILKDTAGWEKIEGSFIAGINDNYITIGNFFDNAVVSIVVTDYLHSMPQYSYYFIDDVSIIPIDLAANAGKDSHAELGKKVQIGRVGDTTAQGLDCKWYRKGVLIDSGAIISVNAGTSVGKIDTYVVVQTVCGLVKTDTVTVKTVPVGFSEYNKELEFAVYPNPSNGAITITTPHAVIPQGSLHAKVYDLLGRAVYQNQVSFSNNQASLHLNVADGVYILELTDNEGDASRQRIEIRK